jgi:hypothetical protein
MVTAQLNVKSLGETQNRAIDLLPSYWRERRMRIANDAPIRAARRDVRTAILLASWKSGTTIPYTASLKNERWAVLAACLGGRPALPRREKMGCSSGSAIPVLYEPGTSTSQGDSSPESKPADTITRLRSPRWDSAHHRPCEPTGCPSPRCLRGLESRAQHLFQIGHKISPSVAASMVMVATQPNIRIAPSTLSVRQ